MPEATLGLSKSVYPCLLSKAQGAFVGLAYGDALGWPQELRPKTPHLRRPAAISPELREWTRSAGGRFYSHRDVVRAGEYSDDTQLTLAVARSRLRGDDSWWQYFTQAELPLWMLYERGGGGASKRAAASWLNSTAPWDQKPDSVRRYFDAGGNGVAMRILPHAVRFAGRDDPAQLIRHVVLDGTATHGHPRALIGAALLAYVTWWLLRLDRTLEFGELIRVAVNSADAWGGPDALNDSSLGWLDAGNSFHRGGYEMSWKDTVDEMLELLTIIESGIARGVTTDDSQILNDLGCFGRQKGAGTVSAAAAIYLCSRYAAQPHRGFLSAAFASGADTDTIAAMTGCLLGSLVGVEKLPRSYQSIQDREYILSISARIANASAVNSSHSVVPRPVTRKDIDRLKHTLSVAIDAPVDLDGVRTATVCESTTQAIRSNSAEVRIWQLRTNDGQTLYVKKFKKTDSPEKHSLVNEPIDAVFGISRTAKAVLLLIHPLTEPPSSRDSNLLTLDEYNQFTGYLRKQGSSPSDLLGIAGISLIQGSHSLDPSRIESLLSRGSALEAACRRWESSRVWVICRADQFYPKRLKDRLRYDSPPLLFGSGEVNLLGRGGLAIIGSEAANVDLINFAQDTGRLVADGGCVLVSGGFTSLEKAALRGAREAGGGIVTHSRETLEPTEVAQAVPVKNSQMGFVTVSDRDPTLSGEVGDGGADRRLVPLLADAALVVEAESEQDYPWSTVAEQLRGPRPGRVFVRVSQNASHGLVSLRKLGALAWKEPQPNADLSSFFNRLVDQTRKSPQAALTSDGSHDGAPTSRPRGRSSNAGITQADGATLKAFETFLVKIANAPQRVDDVAEMLGVEQRVAKRLIRSLVAEGVLEEQAGTGRYCLRRGGGPRP